MRWRAPTIDTRLEFLHAVGLHRTIGHWNSHQAAKRKDPWRVFGETNTPNGSVNRLRVQIDPFPEGSRSFSESFGRVQRPGHPRPGSLEGAPGAAPPDPGVGNLARPRQRPRAPPDAGKPDVPASRAPQTRQTSFLCASLLAIASASCRRRDSISWRASTIDTRLEFPHAVVFIGSSSSFDFGASGEGAKWS